MPILDLLKKKKTYPEKVLTFEVTLKCNLTCQMCYIPEEELKYSKTRLSKEDIRNTVLAGESKYVSFIGGEPFVLPDIADLCEDLFDNGVEQLRITTNGTIYKPDVITKNEKAIREGKLNFTVSLDGKGDLHDEIRKMPGAYDKAIKSLSNYRQICNDLNLDFRSLFDITCVIQKSNAHNLRDIIEIARETGIGKVSYQNMLFCTKNELEETMKLLPYKLDVKELFGVVVSDPSELPDGKFVRTQVESIMEDVKDIKIRLSKNTKLKNFEEHYSFDFKPKLSCTCPNYRMRIDPKGNLIFCKLLRANIGSVTEKNISDLWKSPEMVKGQKAFNKAGGFPICYRCTKERQLV